MKKYLAALVVAMFVTGGAFGQASGASGASGVATGAVSVGMIAAAVAVVAVAVAASSNEDNQAQPISTTATK